MIAFITQIAEPFHVLWTAQQVIYIWTYMIWSLSYSDVYNIVNLSIICSEVS